MFKSISEDGPRKHLEKFTSFHTRYYKSETGRQSQAWLFKTITDLVKPYDFVSVKEFPHPWGQNSILLNIAGSNKTLTEKKGVTILGAHQDSTNLFPFFAAPGADDDGSGTVTIIEALRVLLQAGWRPESDVELHWYSAEEGGLLGSQAVAQSYERANTKVNAMLQQDMTAFVKSGTTETVGLVPTSSLHPSPSSSVSWWTSIWTSATQRRSWDMPGRTTQAGRRSARIVRLPLRQRLRIAT